MLVQRDAGEVTLGRKLEVKSVAKIYRLGSGSDLFVEQLILPVLYDMCINIQDFSQIFGVYLDAIKCLRDRPCIFCLLSSC
jgi:hypothetical protein